MTEEIRIAMLVMAGVLALLAAVFHFLSAFFRPRIRGAVPYINIVIHIALFFDLFLVGASLAELVAVLMASVCLYSLFSYLALRREGHHDI